MDEIDITAVNTASPIARGGTAAVFHLYGRSDVVAKIYNDVTKIDVGKLKCLQSIDLKSNQSCFGYPISLIVENGRERGYTQQYFRSEDYSTLDNWIEQGLSDSLRPHQKDLKFKLHILRALAELIQILHYAHLCIVDLKPANVLVNNTDGSVSLIDCDSFCILDDKGTIKYPAHEVTVGYFEPDSLVAKKSISQLSYSQDCYAFGVIAFQLLNNGIHPYQGIWTLELEDYNLEFLSTRDAFPYARQQPESVRPLPTSVHDTFPDPLRTLFDRTFVRDLPRVTIQNWLNVLRAVQQSDLVEACTNSDPFRHSKFKSYPCAVCLHEERIRSIPVMPSTVRKPVGTDKATGPMFNKAPPKRSLNQLLWMGLLIVAIPIVALIVLSIRGDMDVFQSSTYSPTPAEQPASASDLDNTVLCRNALSTSKQVWDQSDRYAKFVEEAQRRALSVQGCRIVLGLDDNSGSSSSTSNSSSSSTSIGLMDRNSLCRNALSASKYGWESGAQFAEYVAEAQRRNLSVQDCRDTLGLDAQPAEEQTSATPAKSFKPYGNSDIVGGDISHGSTSSFEQCQQRCEDSSSCVAFVFDKWNSHCILKSSVTALRGEPKAISYVIESIQPPKLNDQFRIDQFENKKFFATPFMTLNVQGRDACLQRCSDDKNCWAFNYTYKNRQCEMFDNLDAAYRSSRGTMVGIFRQ